MSENATEMNPADCEDGELRDALLAAFGTEAMGWLEECDDDLSPDSVGSPTAPAEGPGAVAADAGLDEVLAELSQSLQDGEMPTVRSREPGNGRVRTRVDTAMRHVVFEAGGQHFAVPLQGVQEIDRCGKVTPLPRTPDWLRGVTNLRGRIFSVTDFRRLLNLRDESPAPAEKIIVIQSRRLDMHTALVVDRVLGIRSLAASHDDISLLTGNLAKYASGIWAGENETIVLIDPDQILDCSNSGTNSDS